MFYLALKKEGFFYGKNMVEITRGYTNSAIITIPTALSISPTDATIYYHGSLGILDTGDINRVYILRAGTVTRIDIFMLVLGTLGSTETSTMAFRLNNSTDTTISSAVTADAIRSTFNNTALSIAVAAGDYFELKWTTPTWATNPTVLYHMASVYIE